MRTAGEEVEMDVREELDELEHRDVVAHAPLARVPHRAVWNRPCHAWAGDFVQNLSRTIH